MSVIRYQNTKSFPGWSAMPAFMEDFILRHGIKSVFEIGAGANPTLSPDVVRKLGIAYTINDISIEELNKADIIYKKNAADLCRKDIYIPEKYDLVFSRMAGEHFNDAGTLHSNIYQMLSRKGMALHCYSTLYALPFLINKFVPDFMTEKLLYLFYPRDPYQHKKFKAYYNMAYGPTEKMISFLEGKGYTIKEFTGYFGHNYYEDIPLLRNIEALKADWLVRHPVPALTSYALVILQKPEAVVELTKIPSLKRS